MACAIVGLAPSRSAWNTHFMFFTYRSAGLLALALWLWAANILVFESYGVNHVFVLQTSERDYLHPSQLLWCAALWTIAVLAAFFLQASNAALAWTDHPGAPPLAAWGLGLALLVLPAPVLLHNSRRVLGETVGRVLLAPFPAVLFRDVLMGDILTSLVRPMCDFAHFSCFLLAGQTGDGTTQPQNATVLRLDVDACGRSSPGR
jgi:hypothetical protein